MSTKKYPKQCIPSLTMYSPNEKSTLLYRFLYLPSPSFLAAYTFPVVQINTHRRSIYHRMYLVCFRCFTVDVTTCCTCFICFQKP